MQKSKIHYLNLILYFVLSITLLAGYFLGEDSSGSGGFPADFNSTWPILKLIENGEYFNFSEYTIHFPLHYYILYFLNLLFENKEAVRLLFTLISLITPYLFFLILREKFSNIDLNKLFFFSQIIFLFPSFRSGAIWANTQLTALVFFMISIFYFLKWENQRSNLINKNLVLQCFFLSLAVYSRQLYAMVFIYILYIYFIRLDFKEFLKSSIMIFIFSLPGIFLALSVPRTFSLTFDFNLANSLMVNASIISFYLIPLYFVIGLNYLEDFKKSNITKGHYAIILLSFLLVLFSSTIFDYNPILGGGFFLKLSIIIFDNLYFFFVTSFIGIILIMLIFKENKNTLILFLLLIFGFSSYQIFQKYFEPMFIILLFSLIEFSKIKLIFKNYINIVLFQSYFIVYLISAIINDIFKITKTFT